MNSVFKHSIDYKKVANGLGLSVDDTKAFFNDGRIIGRLAEFIYANKTNSKRSKSENAAYDVDAKNGDKIEVRSITGQISFGSSKEYGFGRKITNKGFRDKLNSVDYFVGIDFRNLSNLDFIKISKDDIKEMENEGLLRKNKSVSSKKLFNKIKTK